jgi:hypothetical protein
MLTDEDLAVFRRNKNSYFSILMPICTHVPLPPSTLPVPDNNIMNIHCNLRLFQGSLSSTCSTSPRPALWPTKPRIQWVPWALSPRVKRPGCEADHSPPLSAEVKKIWIYTYINSPIRLYGVVLN